MMSGGFIDDIIGAGVDLIGGAIGSAFGDDTPTPGYGDKEYGTEARRMRFGTNVGRRKAMGDPTIDAYFQSKLRTDPELVQRFIDDFGADFRTEGEDYSYPAVGSPAGGMFPPTDPRARLTPGLFGGINETFANEAKKRSDIAASNTAGVLNSTLARLSRPGAGQQASGYSGDLGGFNFGGDKRDPSFFQNDMTKSVSLKKRDIGEGNKYAKLNQERKTGMF